jgi:putative oxidoreductase
MGLIYPPFPGLRGSVGLLLIRGVTGAAFIFHGWPKIQNATTWMGPNADMPGFMQAAAAASEFGGGIALIAGLLTPLACLAIAGVMVTAISTVHLKYGHAFVGKPGEPSWELAAVYLCIVLAVLLLGPGKLSLDGLIFGRSRPTEGEPAA